jgi:hypothetical protein
MMKRSEIMKAILKLTLLVLTFRLSAQDPVALKWHKFELTFTSDIEYENPVQDLRVMEATFTSPSGEVKTVNAFWDGGKTWKVRFMPWETGTWTYSTECSDLKNTGLGNRRGSFTCNVVSSDKDIYIHGPLNHPPGTYFLVHQDGTPFFWLACTAWNGALKSSELEWESYLKQRVENNYSVIQFVTTQWRGCDKSSEGLVAFEGCGKIRINPEFFRLIDKKIDRVNDYGLVAAPVILWALQTGSGRELSPGYYLPDDQAILLAKYIVARYGANHVVWFLGGDGNYTDPYEQRWKNIGRAVFDGKNQGIVAMHPQGRSWIGEVYRDESWLDIVGYQSSHSNNEATVNWINKGPVSRQWSVLPARPLINLEPNYEEIRTTITDRDVRNASYWSLFAAPVAGISYGANGIWPWLRKGEKILNHADAPWTSTWEKSIDLPGSIQMGYLAGFIRKFEWWNLYPADELLITQPGNDKFNRFVSLVKSIDNKTIMGYLPEKMTIELRKPVDCNYDLMWFDPLENSFLKGSLEDSGTVLKITSLKDQDMLFVLGSKD